MFSNSLIRRNLQKAGICTDIYCNYLGYRHPDTTDADQDNSYENAVNNNDRWDDNYFRVTTDHYDEAEKFAKRQTETNARKAEEATRCALAEEAAKAALEAGEAAQNALEAAMKAEIAAKKATAIEKRIEIDMTGRNFLATVVEASSDYSNVLGYLAPNVISIARNAVTKNTQNNALHLAVTNGNLTLVNLLLKTGFSVNKANRFGDTPLHLAANLGNRDIAEALIKNGASIKIQNKSGLTPEKVASANLSNKIKHSLEVKSFELSLRNLASFI